MKFHDEVKGKITINIDKIGTKLNSSINFKGLAKNPDVVLTSLLVNFVSFAINNGKDPKKIISQNLDSLIDMVQQNKGSSKTSKD